MTPLHRRLDRAEAFFWLLDRCSSMNFAILAEGEGEVPLAGLRRALERAQQIHPALSCTIDADGDGHLAFVPRAGEIPIEDSIGAGLWRSTLAARMVEPFPLGAAPLVRAHRFDLDGGRWAFALVFHHAIGDGRSGMRLAIEILDESRGGRKQTPRDCDTAPLTSLFPDEYAGERGAARAAAWRESQRLAPRPPKPDPLPGFARAEGAPLASMLTLAFGREEVDALAAQARARAASVHGAIGAAELIAVRERFGAEDPAMMLTSPVDLRASLARPVDDATPGFHVTLLSTTSRVAGRESFWDLARHVTQDLRRQLAGGFGHLFYHFIPAAETITPDDAGISGFRAYMARMPQACLLSNVGRVRALPDAGTARIGEISFALCPMAHQPLFVAATTWGGRLVLNVNYDSRRLPADTAAGIARGMESILRSAISG
jgi:hypothetical protein